MAESPWLHALLVPTRLTWDVLGPADDDHELSVRQVTESGQGLDVTLRHARGRHGVELVGLGHQQIGDNLGHCNDQRWKVNAWEKGKGAEKRKGVEPGMGQEEKLAQSEVVVISLPFLTPQSCWQR